MNRLNRLVRGTARLVRVALFGRAPIGAIVSAVVFAFTAASVLPAGAIDPGALPTGGKIVSGQGTISVSGSQMTVTQQQNKMIANWDTFNIGTKAGVTFVQPSASSTALNRILDQNPSQILGSLKSNGQVFLLNPNGIIFGANARIDVGGLVASSLELSDADYLSGRFQFTNSGSAGSIVNQGSIITPEHGVVALIAPQVSNQGTITTPGGSVALAGGNRVALDFVGDGLIKVSVDEAALNAAIRNNGAIKADGGQVVMTASAAGDLMATVINNTGIIEANSIASRNGVIVLDGGERGVVSNSGTIAAVGGTAGTSGGSISILGNDVRLTGAGVLDASGDSGGGTVLVGGNYQGKGPEANAANTTVESGVRIAADAVTSGNGGKVVVWSDVNTDFAGAISARGGAVSGDGGLAEVSGKQSLLYTGFTDLRAPNGAVGSLLLDPSNFTVAASGGNITGAALGGQLGAAAVKIATSASGSEAGDIFVNDNVTWGSANLLTLAAHNNVNVNAALTCTGGGSVRLRADSDADNGGTVNFSETGG